jgi:hypothetical protein
LSEGGLARVHSSILRSPVARQFQARVLALPSYCIECI